MLASELHVTFRIWNIFDVVRVSQQAYSISNMLLPYSVPASRFSSLILYKAKGVMGLCRWFIHQPHFNVATQDTEYRRNSYHN